METIGYSPICASLPNQTKRKTPPSPPSKKAGHPVVRIALPNIHAIGQEFFRWEIATAVAGSIIGINAFKPARCRSQQSRNAQAHQRVRKPPAVSPRNRLSSRPLE